MPSTAAWAPATAPPRLTATASCPTTDNGSRTVKGKVLDKDGGSTEYTAYGHDQQRRADRDLQRAGIGQ